jgi:hypothetical protein
MRRFLNKEREIEILKRVVDVAADLQAEQGMCQG